MEDEGPLREIVCEILEPEGYQVIACADAEAALATVAAREEPIDLVLADVGLAGMSGVELLLRLRTQRPAQRGLLLSGYPAVSIDRHGVDVEVLSKPFTVDQRLAAVRSALGR